MVPKLAAVRNSPLAKAAASGAAVVSQYWFMLALMPPRIPQRRITRAVKLAEVPAKLSSPYRAASTKGKAWTEERGKRIRRPPEI